MRIITGQYKGRHFDIPRSFKARPTTDFAKENLFNVLNGYIDFDDITALDLFSGTGSISLELVSRGCARVVSVEADRDHHAFISQCLKKLGTDVCTPYAVMYSASSSRADSSLTSSLPILPMLSRSCRKSPTLSSTRASLPLMASSSSSMARITTSPPIPALSSIAPMAV